MSSSLAILVSALALTAPPAENPATKSRDTVEVKHCLITMIDHLRLSAREAGPIVKMGAVDMDFNYVEHFGERLSTGYERLLFDCMTGDATLFQRADMVEASWRIVTPILDVWAAIPKQNFPNYAAGSWGPAEADEMMARDGRHWKNVEPLTETANAKH